MADLLEFLKGAGGPQHDVRLRRDPEPRPRSFTVISVDDHLVEPPDVFAGRLPRRLRDAAPRVERHDGADHWVFDDERVPLLGIEGIQSWEPGHGRFGPVTYEDFRPGVWQVDARVRDMDLNGVAASLNFPSAIFGFAGQRFMRMKDADAGLASMRAFNDWVIEAWAGPHPDRIIPCQVTWLPDPEVAAGEIRRNAARGFKAVAFTENPEKLGLPSINTRHWDPFLAACEETATVVNLHVGSSSQTMLPSTDSSPLVLGILFPVNAFAATADWLLAGVPARFPALRIALSEGGIGWVPMLKDRLDYMLRQATALPMDVTAAGLLEALHRNFWFTTFSDARSLALRHEVGVDRIMYETDYPHTDSSWPDTQEILAAQLGGIPPAEAAMMTHGNAAALYRHPVNGATTGAGSP